MARLFGQEWYLSVGTLDLSDLDIAYKVTRTTRHAPNIAEIRVWNLAPNTRAQVEASDRGRVLLRAGFEDPAVLFSGDARTVWTEIDGVDRITVIQGRDGGRAYADTRISRSYAPGTRCTAVLRDVVADLEIGEGNLDEYAGALTLRNGSDRFADGYVAAGPARRVMDALMRGAGLRWSVQGGALQIMRRGAPLQSRAVVLSSDSGMIESPTWDDNRRRRTLTVRTLIQPGIEPGRKVRVEAELVSGDFEVKGVEYVGDTRGADWTATLALRPLG